MVLRTHGLYDEALQATYKSVVVAKLLYATSAWWGFISVSDWEWANDPLSQQVM